MGLVYCHETGLNSKKNIIPNPDTQYNQTIVINIPPIIIGIYTDLPLLLITTFSLSTNPVTQISTCDSIRHLLANCFLCSALKDVTIFRSLDSILVTIYKTRAAAPTTAAIAAAEPAMRLLPAEASSGIVDGAVPAAAGAEAAAEGATGATGAAGAAGTTAGRLAGAVKLLWVAF